MSDSAPPIHPSLGKRKRKKKIKEEGAETLTCGLKKRFPGASRIREHDRDCGSDICKHDQV